jgi:hypothetical protein
MSRTILLFLAVACGSVGCTAVPSDNRPVILPTRGGDNQVSNASWLSDAPQQVAERAAGTNVPTTQPTTRPATAQTDPDPFAMPYTVADASRVFKDTKPLRLRAQDGQVVLDGIEDFERRQEAFTVLMSAYFFGADRLTGMSRQEAEEVFGPGTPDVNGSKSADRYIWDAGRDVLIMEYHRNRVVFAAFVMGE